MNTMIQRFLMELKSKQPVDYNPSDFFDKAMDLMVLYYYADSEEERKILRVVYDRMWAYLNPLKRGGQLNPRALDLIDKQLKHS